MALTAKELELLRRAFDTGPSAFERAGYTPERIKEFMSRPDTVEWWNLSKAEYDNADAIRSRNKFAIRRKAGHLAHRALRVLERSLRGPHYRVDSSGALVMDKFGNYVVERAEPTAKQLQAATYLVDLVADDDTEEDRSNTLDVVFQVEAKPQLAALNDPNNTRDFQHALSRERIRTVLDRLRPAIEAARAGVDTEIKVSNPNKGAAAPRKLKRTP